MRPSTSAASHARRPVAIACHAQPPGERQCPHPPELCPRARATPHVAPPLVAQSRCAREERGEGGRGRGGPPAEAEETPRRVDRDRPERQQQVERPAGTCRHRRRATGWRSRCAAATDSGGSDSLPETGTGTTRRTGDDPRGSARPPTEPSNGGPRHRSDTRRRPARATGRPDRRRPRGPRPPTGPGSPMRSNARGRV